VLGGLALGFLAAAGGSGAWRLFGPQAADEVVTARPAPERVRLFRLTADADRAALLVPAGPDETGEPRLAAALFPGEDPARELASLLFANVSPDRAWDVDLATRPVRCRGAGDAEWRVLTGAAERGAQGRLDPADALRLRALGGTETRLVVEPHSVRRVLVALPPGRRMEDLSDVQWGDAPFVRDELDLERLRRFREDPAAVTTGR
jgi:hypothetical protein